jgi:nicotinamidase-related amidase
MRILPEHTLDIGIDFQERLLPAMDDEEAVVKNSAILLAGLELLDIPVLITRQYPKGLGDTVEEIRAVTGKARVFDKTVFNCYQDAAVKAAVDQLGQARKNVIICGTEAHICVLQSTLDLLAAGYNVVCVIDCAASRKFNDKKFGLKRAAAEGAILATYESILFELTAGTDNPAFKGISKLVK